MGEAGTEGVYYATKDLAGFWARFAVLAIDLSVLAAIIGVSFLVGHLGELPSTATNLVAVALAWAYMAGLKAGGRSTLGYRALGVQLVDIQGKPPTLLQTTIRFMFLFFGPLNGPVDSLWLTGDPDRQTLRDKLAKTYVIRKGAVPAGTGRVTYTSYFVGGLAFVFAEVWRLPKR